MKRITENDNGVGEKEARQLVDKPESVDRYCEDSEQDEFLVGTACWSMGFDLMTQLQHMVAGLFGMMALYSNNHDTFVWLIRWGIAFEAGWELGDWAKVIIPSIPAGKTQWMLIIHHCTRQLP